MFSARRLRQSQLLLTPLPAPTCLNRCSTIRESLARVCSSNRQPQRLTLNQNRSLRLPIQRLPSFPASNLLAQSRLCSPTHLPPLSTVYSL